MAKALAILLLALLAFSGGADAKRLKKVKVKRIESLAQTNASFPSISFVGGLELSDGNEHFGGWSGLATRDQGRSAVAVSDKGWWLTLDVEYANDSTPVGVDDVRIHPLLDEVGKALDERKKAWSDAESVVFADKEDPTSGMLVSFERHHRIWSYESVEANATTNSALIVASVALGAHCAYNGGAEGIEVLTPGVGSPRLASMVFFCEDAMADHPNIFQGWVVPVASDGETAQAKPIFMELGEGYRPTDLAVLEGGDLLVLQRMHKGHDATGMRIGLVPSDLIRWALRTSSPAYSASHEGESVLVPAQVLEVIKSPTTLIDNMEGLSVDYLGTNKEDPNRAVRLSLISDDNFRCAPPPLPSSHVVSSLPLSPLSLSFVVEFGLTLSCLSSFSFFVCSDLQ